MSNYTKTVDFAAKDSLPSGDSGKIIKGTEFETEFDNISTAIATKSDSAGPTFTGVLTFASLKGTGATTVTTILDEDDMSTNSATALATQQSIKAYVDAQQDTVDTLAEILALSNATGGTDIAFGDNDKAIFGAGSDLQIYHDGSNSFVADAGTGQLRLLGDDVRIMNAAGTEISAQFIQDGEARLKYDNSTKLATKTGGIDVTGDITLGDTNPAITFNDSSITNLSHIISSASDNLRIKVDVNGVDAGSRVEIFDGTTEVARFQAGAVGVTGTVTADNVGIGTSTNLTNGTLNVVSNGTSVLQARSDSAGVNDGDTSVVVSRALNSTAGKWANATYRGYSHAWSYGSSAATNEAMRIDSSGNVGIGTDSPARLLELKESSTGAGDAIIRLRGNGNNANNTPLGSLEWFNADSSGAQPGVVAAVEAQSANSNGHMGKLLLKTHDGSGSEADPPTTRMTIDQSGSVGIGTDAPGRMLHLNGSSPAIRLQDTDLSGYAEISANDTNSGITFNADPTNSQANTLFAFRVDNSEAMRIDQNRNLLVGLTAVSNSGKLCIDAGTSASGLYAVTDATAGYAASVLERSASDGDITVFKKGGASVGSIGVVNTDNIRIGGTVASHAGIQFGTNILIPETAGTASDGLVDIGTGANRYQDVYATNGTIQTSDGNEKQDIEALSETEQRVAVAAKGLLRKFRWKSAVEEKGEDARIHFGIIAQDLQAAFEAEGLDAGDYGMFINSTWTDEETGEERSRMGVRYSELLAFIISAI